MRLATLWIVWLVTSALFALWLAVGMGKTVPPEQGLVAQARLALLPGETSHGHYQIELACNACHGDAFTGNAALEESCLRCHSDELKAANDSHPLAKFRDPRNADRIALLDARQCISCHVEHKPQITGAMGVTLPEDYCFRCHQDVAENRPSHRGMGFETCASSGCHNFHDNRALYEDFLVKHAQAPWLMPEPQLPPRALLTMLTALNALPRDFQPVALTRQQADAPPTAAQNEVILQHWHLSAHASAGVNCSHCHNSGEAWLAQPDHEQCQSCHRDEVAGFLAGRHGMRLAQGLPAMSPAKARLPMAATAHGELGCHSCHDPHAVNTATAAVEACLGCHADEHTQQYRRSKHYQLWLAEQSGSAPPGSGVSCATCHLPRLPDTHEGRTVARVEHNQNATLRPNEKMLRPVCMQCHGLTFAIDALADPQLLQNNFQGRPSRHIESVDMALKRVTPD